MAVTVWVSVGAGEGRRG
ncbi:hypothetical protein E2C01_095309 [Portunus trituberculatus]|uniref:Uncharacterized protein n=1 Tax=Portunus trituberculatus TaxID=210409 RepID=A0A5B7JZV1_PORTR|nr:hypothetical protein [Portunus trituberculatus]